MSESGTPEAEAQAKYRAHSWASWLMETFDSETEAVEWAARFEDGIAERLLPGHCPRCGWELLGGTSHER